MRHAPTTKNPTCKLNFSGYIFGGPPQLHHLQRPPFFCKVIITWGQHGLQKKMSIPKSKRSILPTYERSSPPRYMSFFVCIAKSPPKKKQKTHLRNRIRHQDMTVRNDLFQQGLLATFLRWFSFHLP